MGEEFVATDPSECWERRHDLEISPHTAADVDDQGADRIEHLVVIARISAADVVAGLRPVLAALDEFGCFESIPVRNLHVTVKIVGDVVADPSGSGEFGVGAVDDIVEAVRTRLAGVSSFRVGFPRLNLFPSVVYAEVVDDGVFGRLNDRLCASGAFPVFDRDGRGFIPHLTLGQFVESSGAGAVIEYVEANRGLSVPSVTVDALELIAVDHSAGRFPVYESVAVFELE